MIQIQSDENKKGKELLFADLTACDEIKKDNDLNQSQAAITSDTQKRSRSLSGMFRKAEKDCGWLFGFTLCTKERTYEFFAPTRQDL